MSPVTVDRIVASLLYIQIKEWDIDVIKDVYNSRDQKKILEIPLDESNTKDVLYWRLENTGMYSVKSAYKMLHMQRGSWYSQDNSSTWKTLWSIKAPPKAVNLVWRALSQCLPTLTQLQLKHVPVQTLYPVCTGEAEMVMHSLVLCPFA